MKFVFVYAGGVGDTAGAVALLRRTSCPIVRYAAPLMEESGSIVAMTFQASERVFPGYNVMGTAKAALENEVRQLSEEYGQRNIRINAISAGPLETLASRGIHGFSEMRNIHAERAPLRRNITHEEVAKTALFLCTDLSSGITGTIIPVTTASPWRTHEYTVNIPTPTLRSMGDA